MPISPLSDLNPGSKDWSVHVYVSRLWHHRGGTDDGPIKHTDLVLHDKQGNHMYAEVAPSLVDEFMERIHEGRVYELRRFLVTGKKNSYRPVEGQFIIRFGRYTTVHEIPADLMDYPLCTYALTPLDDLPKPCDMPESFTDVVGIVTGVSPISQYHSATRSSPSIKRIVYLSDISGFKVSLVLWGERAIAFDRDAVLRDADKGPVVVIFVGTLVKPFEARRGLSGGAPCRWYINEDLPEINEISARLQGKVPIVHEILIHDQTPAEISAQVDLETKTVKELIDLDIYKYQKNKFYCTALITKLSPGQRWWFHGCTTCSKGTVPFGNGYKCPDVNCGGMDGGPRYKICYIGSDDTGEIEFVFFDKTGRELITKTALTLLRSRVPHGMSMEEAIQFGRTDQSTPRELASVIARKLRMVVSVTSKSFDPNVPRPSYQVHRIETEFGKQSRSSALGRRPGLALASSSSSSGSGLSALGNTLADELIKDRAGTSGAVTELSNDPSVHPVDNSLTGSETLLPHTPASVTKPPSAQSSGKAPMLSNVKRALQYEDSSPLATSEIVSELVPQIQQDKTGLLLVQDESATIACRIVDVTDSGKLAIPGEDPALALLPNTDVVSEEFVQTLDDPTIPPEPAVVPTPEKTAGSKRRQLAQKADGAGRKKKST